MRKLFISLCILSYGSLVFGQAKLVEKVERKPGELTISYQKYVLPNGLTVIVHEDHSDPVVHVDVTYHVGSCNETPGKSGFAHFFEHMMFQGSKHVGDDQHFKIVTEAGGTLNGTTNRDRTNYFETVPKNKLEIAMWLEADRMGFLLDSVTQQKFEIQRSTVKNERGQNYDNRPYGLVPEVTARALYPQGHPYSWLTIGYISHLDAVDVNDLKAFFMRWYGPNNATLTVGGDVSTQDVVKLAEKYFGPIPSCPPVEKMNPMIPALTESRYVSMSDNIRFPLLQIIYPSSPQFTDDETSLDILAAILSEGKSSPFYTNFIKSKIANSANVYNSTSQLSGEFTISIRAFPDKKLSDINDLINKTMAQFEERGITDDDLTKAKAKAEKSLVSGLESVSGKVSQLASYQTFTGNPNQIQKYLDDVRKVSKEDVMRVYNKYIKGKNFVALSVYPKGKENLAKADSYKNPAPDAPAPHTAVAINYKDPKDSFDRSKKPAAGDVPLVKAPKYFTIEMPNGLSIYASTQTEVPLISFQLIMKGGQLLDRSAGMKDGLCALTARMMNEATVNYTAEQFNDELDKIGSSIFVSQDDENTYINVNCLAKNIDRTMELFHERLLSPKFEQEAFDRIKMQTLENIENSYTVPATIAANNWQRIIYGAQSVKGTPASGTKESVGSITLADVQSFYNSFYAPDQARIVLAGDISMQGLASRVGFLNGWAKKNYIVTPPAYNSTYMDNVVYFINKDGAAQSEIRVGYLGMPYDALGNYYKCGLMNYQLGGAFNSRINMELREEKGWTYGARSTFNGSKYQGPFTVAGGFRKDATDSTIVEIFKNLKNYSSSISAEDLTFTQSAITCRDALRFETLGQKSGFINQLAEYKLPDDYTLQQNKILMGLTVSDLKDLANKNLPSNKMKILVVGDKATCFEKLQKLGYKVVELDKDGKLM